MNIVTGLGSSSTALLKSMEFDKALASGYSFDVFDQVEADYRAINKPSLLTSMFMNEFDVNTHRVSSFIYDRVNISAQLPGGKSYTDRGPDLNKDLPTQLTFSIPSFGLIWNVSPQDYREKRVPGGAPGELMDEAYVVGRMQEKGLTAWDLLNEVALAKLIVDDQNIVLGGPGTQYTFHQSIWGSARPTAVALDLANSDETTVRLAMVAERRKLEQKLAEAGKSARGFVVISGETFFDERMALEEQSSLGRDLNRQVDLASQRVPEITVGEMTYDAFTPIDGITYIRYGSTIQAGGKLIGDDDAYLMPVGVENMFTIELAPAITRDTVNQEAEAMYMWTKEDYRKGVMTEMESNRLYMNRNPELITALSRLA